MAIQEAQPTYLQNVAMLDRFIRARNARRSSEKEADGFTSGNKTFNLKAAIAEEAKAFNAIIDWAEEKAREELESKVIG